MNKVNKGNLIINGVGSSNGGTFQTVAVSGKSTVNSDIECEVLESNGVASFKGNIVSQTVRINGTTTIAGSLDTEKISIEGVAKIKKDVTAAALQISGSGSFGGTVRCDSIKIEGRAAIAENCEAETVYIRGPVKIGGELNADHILLEPFGRCTIQEIGGQSITVKKDASFSSWLKPFFPTTLSVNSIEGDEIDLEVTAAKVVRGRNVKIGKKCEVDLVEYTGTFQKDDGATVKKSRKI
ncbi:polymer-forming cytoskeletal protein [Heyndrickxia acidiproducens]|uniref:polymer-forming cytoskeletal protein n=1 Tax=Heyndrickxia acidiproducens TaxID=1121084 RepID=UPI00037BF661|nr:polymer-forming cytoskeletal protein [Heyndrickxia acidiproducens]